MNKPERKIFFGSEACEILHNYLDSCISSKRMIFLLVDENTRKFCLPLLINNCDLNNYKFTIIEIQSGEKNKTLETVAFIWEQLTLGGADRKSVLINVGGGVLCDMGGFAASCYNRGIETVNIPTTLLAMVDAAVGGKTGFDFMTYKNHIGSFYQPARIFVFDEFLVTLEIRQIKAGLAEVIKYGFISDQSLLEKLYGCKFETLSFNELIQLCIDAKMEITISDPNEQGPRKILNFGHTVGHAIESFALYREIDILHGEAVAVGLLCELWLSVKYKSLDNNVLNNYIRFYRNHFSNLTFVFENADEIIDRMMLDKKNSSGLLKFVLIGKPGEPIWDEVITSDGVKESLVFYNSLK